MEFQAIFFMLLLALTSGRVINDDDNLQELAYEIEREAHIEENEVDVYESDEYNRWVEKILKSFSNEHSVDETGKNFNFMKNLII